MTLHAFQILYLNSKPWRHEAVHTIPLSKRLSTIFSFYQVVAPNSWGTGFESRPGRMFVIGVVHIQCSKLFNRNEMNGVLDQENLLKMIRWIRWSCPPDTWQRLPLGHRGSPQYAITKRGRGGGWSIFKNQYFQSEILWNKNIYEEH